MVLQKFNFLGYPNTVPHIVTISYNKRLIFLNILNYVYLSYSASVGASQSV